MNTSTAVKVEQIDESQLAQERKTARVIHLSAVELQVGGKEKLAAMRSVMPSTEKESDAEFEPANDDNNAPSSSQVVVKKPLYYRFIKRLFDIVFSACVIVVGFIPGLILSIFIARDTGGSPIYSSVRVGRDGKLFRIYKFRSMVADSDDLEKYFTPEQLEQWHQEHKVDDDPRITKLGAFLRSSSIDEFPQFINALFGQISIIGPRVITEEELSYFGSDQDLLMSCPPGIAWDIIAPKPGAGEKSFRERESLPVYEDSQLLEAVAALDNLTRPSSAFSIQP